MVTRSGDPAVRFPAATGRRHRDRPRRGVAEAGDAAARDGVRRHAAPTPRTHGFAGKGLMWSRAISMGEARAWPGV